MRCNTTVAILHEDRFNDDRRFGHPLGPPVNAEAVDAGGAHDGRSMVDRNAGVTGRAGQLREMHRGEPLVRGDGCAVGSGGGVAVRIAHMAAAAGVAAVGGAVDVVVDTVAVTADAAHARVAVDIARRMVLGLTDGGHGVTLQAARIGGLAQVEQGAVLVVEEGGGVDDTGRYAVDQVIRVSPVGRVPCGRQA